LKLFFCFADECGPDAELTMRKDGSEINASDLYLGATRLEFRLGTPDFSPGLSQSMHDTSGIVLFVRPQLPPTFSQLIFHFCYIVHSDIVIGWTLT
jgi:hypothetical protein